MAERKLTIEILTKVAKETLRNLREVNEQVEKLSGSRAKTRGGDAAREESEGKRAIRLAKIENQELARRNVLLRAYQTLRKNEFKDQKHFERIQKRFQAELREREKVDLSGLSNRALEETRIARRRFDIEQLHSIRMQIARANERKRIRNNELKAERAAQAAAQRAREIATEKELRAARRLRERMRAEEIRSFSQLSNIGRRYRTLRYSEYYNETLAKSFREKISKEMARRKAFPLSSITGGDQAREEILTRRENLAAIQKSLSDAEAAVRKEKSLHSRRIAQLREYRYAMMDTAMTVRSFATELSVLGFGLTAFFGGILKTGIQMNDTLRVSESVIKRLLSATSDTSISPRKFLSEIQALAVISPVEIDEMVRLSKSYLSGSLGIVQGREVPKDFKLFSDVATSLTSGDTGAAYTTTFKRIASLILKARSRNKWDWRTFGMLGTMGIPVSQLEAEMGLETGGIREITSRQGSLMDKQVWPHLKRVLERLYAGSSEKMILESSTAAFAAMGDQIKQILAELTSYAQRFFNILAYGLVKLTTVFDMIPKPLKDVLAMLTSIATVAGLAFGAITMGLGGLAFMASPILIALAGLPEAIGVVARVLPKYTSLATALGADMTRPIGAANALAVASQMGGPIGWIGGLLNPAKSASGKGVRNPFAPLLSWYDAFKTRAESKKGFFEKEINTAKYKAFFNNISASFDKTNFSKHTNIKLNKANGLLQLIYNALTKNWVGRGATVAAGAAYGGGAGALGAAIGQILVAAFSSSGFRSGIKKLITTILWKIVLKPILKGIATALIALKSAIVAHPWIAVVMLLWQQIMYAFGYILGAIQKHALTFIKSLGKVFTKDFWSGISLKNLFKRFVRYIIKNFYEGFKAATGLDVRPKWLRRMDEEEKAKRPVKKPGAATRTWEPNIGIRRRRVPYGGYGGYQEPGVFAPVSEGAIPELRQLPPSSDVVEAVMALARADMEQSKATLALMRYTESDAPKVQLAGAMDTVSDIVKMLEKKLFGNAPVGESLVGGGRPGKTAPPIYSVPNLRVVPNRPVLPGGRQRIPIAPPITQGGRTKAPMGPPLFSGGVKAPVGPPLFSGGVKAPVGLPLQKSPQPLSRTLPRLLRDSDVLYPLTDGTGMVRRQNINTGESDFVSVEERNGDIVIVLKNAAATGERQVKKVIDISRRAGQQ